jgi:putative transcriptional regulator
MKFTRKPDPQDDGETPAPGSEKRARRIGTHEGKAPTGDIEPPVPESTEAGPLLRPQWTRSQPQQRKTSKRGYLDGQVLIAMPTMGDERFARTVIYVCAHSDEGAMGIVVNQPASHISFRDLLVQLEVIPAADQVELSKRAGGVKVLKGGPVDPRRGFVLHSSDFYIENSTLPIDEGICLTATVDILKAIVRGDGPKSALLALGYAGWAPGQLENEIQHNGWLHCSADSELIFGQDMGGKYELALKRIGIDLGMLSSEAGHA